MTYTPLANITLGANASSVTFSSIPATYRDLILVADFLGSGGNVNSNVRINSDSGSNYIRVTMAGDGSTASSSSGTTTFLIGEQATTTEKAFHTLNFFDYTQTNKHKSTLARRGRAGLQVQALAERWANTSAITSLQVFTASNSFAIGSTFSLYGIAA